MTSPSEILQINEALADQINLEARANPQSQFAGKWVGIANGKVMVVADDMEEVSRVLDEMEPDSARCFIVEASADYTQVQEIWGPW